MFSIPIHKIDSRQPDTMSFPIVEKNLVGDEGPMIDTFDDGSSQQLDKVLQIGFSSAFILIFL